jgi:lambda family phage minor tail protein L
MTTLKQELNTMNPSPYWEGFIIDLTALGSSVFRFTNASDSAVGFGSFGTFIPFPIKGTNFEVTSDQPPRPKLAVSNVTKVVQPYVQSLSDMVRGKVTRVRTLAKFLDNGTTPDSTQYLPLEVYYIEQKTKHDKFTIEWTLATALDLPFIKIPNSQVLKDDTGGNNMYAPGLSTVRFRG